MSARCRYGCHQFPDLDSRCDACVAVHRIEVRAALYADLARRCPELTLADPFGHVQVRRMVADLNVSMAMPATAAIALVEGRRGDAMAIMRTDERFALFGG